MAPYSLETTSKILFITATRIGDAVLSTSLLKALMDRYPGAEITIACGPAPAPLFAGIPGLKDVHIMRKKKRAGHWVDLWKKVVDTRWTHVVDLRRSTLPYMVWASHRTSFPKTTQPVHKVVQYAQALKLEVPEAPTLWETQESIQASQRILPADMPIIAVGPTANWAGKQWPQENFAALLQQIEFLPQAKIAVFAAPNEQDSIAGFLQSVPQDRLINCIGCGDLLAVYSCLKRCHFYVGNDSGLMHLAAASGVPTLGLFGPSNEALYAPWGENTAFVRTPETMAELISHEDYDHRTTGTLMESLCVQSVVQAAQTLYQRVYDAP